MTRCSSQVGPLQYQRRCEVPVFQHQVRYTCFLPHNSISVIFRIQCPVMPQHSSALGTPQWSPSIITECQFHALTFICPSSHVVQVCFLLLASPSLRKLGSVAAASTTLAAREHWSGRDAVGSIFSPCDARGLSISAQVKELFVCFTKNRQLNNVAVVMLLAWCF